MPRPGIHILVADDDLINQKEIRRMLEIAGCQPEVVSNGEAALAALTRTQIDLVMMDIEMPGMGDSLTKPFQPAELAAVIARWAGRLPRHETVT